MKNIENRELKKIICFYKTFIITLLSLSILFLFISCRNSAKGKTPIDIYKIEDEEYEVYSVLLKGNDQSQLTIISDTTTPSTILTNRHQLCDRYSIGRSGSILYGYQKFLSISDIGFNTLKNFERKNSLSSFLDYKFKIKNRYLLIKPFDKYDLLRLDEKGRGFWQEFYSCYPNSKEIISFSRVGFNHKHNKALVFREIRLTRLGGHGNLFYLQKINGSWKIIKNITVWFS